MTSDKVFPDKATDQARKRLTAAKRKASRARRFPVNTCPASRHLHMLADGLANGSVPFMLQEEPQHCAEDVYAVITALWKARDTLLKIVDGVNDPQWTAAQAFGGYKAVDEIRKFAPDSKAGR